MLSIVTISRLMNGVSDPTIGTSGCSHVVFLVILVVVIGSIVRISRDFTSRYIAISSATGISGLSPIISLIRV